MKNKKIRLEEEMLKEFCPFTKVCSEGDYGSEDVCKNDYLECQYYQIHKDRVERRENG